MPVSGIDTILANQGSYDDINSKNKSKDNSLGKDSFLKLLCTQLQYQDPLNPVENTEFTSQLAQFSSLEALTDMSEAMNQMGQLQGSMNNIETLSFIGKQINAVGNIVNYRGNEIDLGFELDADAKDVVVEIFNDKGKIVRAIDMTNVNKGDVTCTWDGKDKNGDTVADGRYSFSISAKDMDGKKITGKTLASGTVTGVRYADGITYLVLGDKEVTISDVEKITG